MALLSVFGVNSFANIVKVGFGNINVIFFIGVFILSAFINKSGLGKRLVNICLSITGNSTKFILLGFIVTGVILSMWISNMAVAAMLMPLAKSLLDEEGIAVRGGLHCAPGVHRCLGTLEGGAVRVSPGLMNTAAEAKKLIDAVWRIAKE